MLLLHRYFSLFFSSLPSFLSLKKQIKMSYRWGFNKKRLSVSSFKRTDGKDKTKDMNKELQICKCSKWKYRVFGELEIEKPDSDRRVRKDLLEEAVFTLRHEGWVDITQQIEAIKMMFMCGCVWGGAESKCNGSEAGRSLALGAGQSLGCHTEDSAFILSSDRRNHPRGKTGVKWCQGSCLCWW